MRASTACSNHAGRPICPSTLSARFSRQINEFPSRRPRLGFVDFKGEGLYKGRSFHSICTTSGRCQRTETKSALSSSSPWDDYPYEELPGGKRLYLDEQDVVTFLDPPKELIPLDPASFNPAAYLWKKIDDIPVERRHRLLQLITPRLISTAWEIAGTRYEDPKLAKRSASNLLSREDGDEWRKYWNCRTSGGPMPFGWMNFFKKVIFHCRDGTTYGRLIGSSFMASFASSIYPLYFTVRQLDEVMSTEQPCDLAYEFGDGLLNLPEYPEGFPKPAKHPWPFNDQVVIYMRHLGPGVMVAQAWQEGEALEKVPQKLCGEILMVEDYAASDENR